MQEVEKKKTNNHNAQKTILITAKGFSDSKRAKINVNQSHVIQNSHGLADRINITCVDPELSTEFVQSKSKENFGANKTVTKVFSLCN